MYIYIKKPLWLEKKIYFSLMFNDNLTTGVGFWCIGMEGEREREREDEQNVQTVARFLHSMSFWVQPLQYQTGLTVSELFNVSYHICNVFSLKSITDALITEWVYCKHLSQCFEFRPKGTEDVRPLQYQYTYFHFWENKYTFWIIHSLV